MNSITIPELVRLYGLEPHPEGGYFKETYRASGTIPEGCLPKYGGARSYSTGIYFLLPEGSISKFHRIRSDEMWHFYLGGPLTIVQITLEGRVQNITLGQDVKSGQKLQHVVPAGHWFGAYPNSGSKFSFVGCTVAPGFDLQDFEMGKRAELAQKYPAAKEVIEKLTD